MIDDKKQKLFLKGIELFKNREFYDAHEYWEKLWLEYQLDDKKFTHFSHFVVYNAPVTDKVNVCGVQILSNFAKFLLNL